jgi:hypothetical protein
VVVKPNAASTQTLLIYGGQFSALEVGLISGIAGSVIDGGAAYLKD